METKWKPTLLSSPPGWLPNWTSATKVQIGFTYHASDVGEVTGQSQRVRFCKIVHSRHFSPSPPSKKKNSHCHLLVTFVQRQGTTSSEVGHHGIHVIQLCRWFILRTLHLPATSKCSKCQTVQKTNGKEDHLRVPPWFLLRVQRIQRWDLRWSKYGWRILQISKCSKNRLAIPSLPPNFNAKLPWTSSTSQDPSMPPGSEYHFASPGELWPRVEGTNCRWWLQ